MEGRRFDVAYVWLLGGLLVVAVAVAVVVGLVLVASVVAVDVLPLSVTRLVVIGFVTYKIVCWIGRWIEGL